jgi:hypothetical protein
MIKAPETSRSLTNRSFFALLLCGGMVPVLYYRNTEDMFTLNASKLPVRGMKVHVNVEASVLEIVVASEHISLHKDDPQYIGSPLLRKGRALEPTTVTMRLPASAYASASQPSELEQLEGWAKLLTEHRTEYTARLQHSFVESLQALADAEDEPVLPGTRISVQGQGEGVYQAFNRSKVGANQHTVDFSSGGGVKKIKLKGATWTVLEAPALDPDRRWIDPDIAHPPELIMVGNAVTMSSRPARELDPQLERDLEVVRSFINTKFGAKDWQGNDRFSIWGWGGLCLKLDSVRRFVKDKASKDSDDMMIRLQGRPQEIGTGLVQLFALLRAVAHQPLVSLSLNNNKLTDDEGGLALAAALPYFHNLQILQIRDNCWSPEVWAAIRAAVPAGCESSLLSR